MGLSLLLLLDLRNKHVRYPICILIYVIENTCTQDVPDTLCGDTVMGVFTRLRQASCLHWFGAVTTYEYTAGAGAIVCNEQVQYRYKLEKRLCSRCGLVDTRVIECEYEGWG